MFSSARIRWETAEGVRCSSRAAASKEPDVDDGGEGGELASVIHEAMLRNPQLLSLDCMSMPTA